MVDNAQQRAYDRFVPANGAAIFFDNAQAKSFFTERASLGCLHVGEIAEAEDNVYQVKNEAKASGGSGGVLRKTGDEKAHNNTKDHNGYSEYEPINQQGSKTNPRTCICRRRLSIPILLLAILLLCIEWWLLSILLLPILWLSIRRWLLSILRLCILLLARLWLPVG